MTQILNLSDYHLILSDEHSRFVIRSSSQASEINPMAARTLERSELLLVPLKAIHELIDMDPSFARAIMYELAGELREFIKHFKNQRLRTTVERLAEWMLRSDQDAGGTGHFVIPYGKRVLASHLGMAPENLSRNLASLAPLGVAVRGTPDSSTDFRAPCRDVMPKRACHRELRNGRCLPRPGRSATSTLPIAQQSFSVSDS